VITHT